MPGAPSVRGEACRCDVVRTPYPLAGGPLAYFKSLFPGKIASIAELGPCLPAADKVRGSGSPYVGEGA
eukprot:4107097-Pyramimonas_sp.AAC.1